MQIHAASRWVRLTADAAPRIGESDLFRFREVRPGAVIKLGNAVEVVADADGRGSLKFASNKLLQGHIGMIELSIDDVRVGEIEVVPDKLSAEAYRHLRADLERTWMDLTLDARGISSIQAGPPTPAELWRRIETPTHQILLQPHESLLASPAYRRADRVRAPRELTPAVLRAHQRNASARVNVLGRTIDTPENRMVADTLARLLAYAVRCADQETASATRRALASDPFRSLPKIRSRHATYVLDTRYRQLLQVRRILLRPELEPVEGPGEVRLGVQGLSRLYEYWTFLQVLTAARAKYGEPRGRGFSILRTETNQHPRIEIPRGASVEFPGGVTVAFEPTIDPAAARSWNRLEYVQHPDRSRSISFATPDVVVFRRGGKPELLVIDAKYVGRFQVESQASRMHEKYARITFEGHSVVSQVLTLHPHANVAARAWAGYGHQPLTPGVEADPLPLPEAAAPEIHASVAISTPAISAWVPTGRLLLLHQRWSSIQLAGRRFDLSNLRRKSLGTLETVSRVVMPDIPFLGTFAEACRLSGWLVTAHDPVAEQSELNTFLELAEHAVETRREVVLFSGDPAVVKVMQDRLGPNLTLFDDIEQIIAIAAEK